MENEGSCAMNKRMRTSVEDGEMINEVATNNVGEDAEENVVVSELVEHEIAGILEKINNFTQQVSELLESGKLMLKELSNEFEERMILIHKEQMEKWQDKIKRLRSLDASNEEIDAMLQNAKCLLQGIPGNS
ncbi:hypothetical protein Leryth_011233 [Lithospermum erythrorhizon]|uniref:Knotted 1-binding protein 36 n=1 Tax=Lithospermum erythrorhizon TaxID=34254 RepID=A0AAV3P3D6_LITER|nr:hypothetical protein Leryth_011233 [Lithospermum erythrorhizon]